MSKTLSQSVGEFLTFDLGPRGKLIGLLELKQDSQFLNYKHTDSGRVEVFKSVCTYALTLAGKSFWYSLGAVGSPFDGCCTVNEKNEIVYTERAQGL